MILLCFNSFLSKLQTFDQDLTQLLTEAIETEASEPDIKIDKNEETSDERYRQLLKRYEHIKDVSDVKDTKTSSFVVINSENEVKKLYFDISL